MRKRLMAFVAILGLMLAGLTFIEASPASAIPGPYSVDLCFKYSIDVRVPYADGTCPAGEDLIPIATWWDGPGVPVCLKKKTDVRAVYNSSYTCPSGMDFVPLAWDFWNSGYGIPVCFKYGEDLRMVYNNGTCPSGTQPVSLIPAYIV
jgi:hypothetical protein